MQRGITRRTLNGTTRMVDGCSTVGAHQCQDREQVVRGGRARVHLENLPEQIGCGLELTPLDPLLGCRQHCANASANAALRQWGCNARAQVRLELGFGFGF